MTKNELNELIDLAAEGNSRALEMVLLDVRDLVFNLSVRMLGTVADAEDASQDILMKVMMKLGSFRKEADFHTWVYRIAANYLTDYKKSMFAQHPLNFDYYANDIRAGYQDTTEEMLMGVSREEMAKELKLSCTNVMLQCLDPQSRCIFILGTMFHVNSKMAGDILDLSPENYRQKLSRAKRKMADFLQAYCGLSGTGCCDCYDRVGYALEQHRIHPRRMEFKQLRTLDKGILQEHMDSMEKLDEKVPVFEELPHYQSNMDVKTFIQNLIASRHMNKIKNYKEEQHD